VAYAESSTLLYLSVAIKLTDDPPEADGSWMHVEGYEPVRYGSQAGSTIMFLSRRRHSSLRTPRNMNKVLKLVLFYKFVDPYLSLLWNHIMQPLPPHAISYQERAIRKACKMYSAAYKPILQTAWTVVPGQRVAPDMKRREAERPYGALAYGMCAEVHG